ncbi:pyrimidine-nucleoside phosphorylase [Paenibacillus abyssi]|uniref:Pyrimidine-nucleoside phosphorylase n=1 Tax=Paenibacillus abyssi TaxID=1340531 RepID=A0A917CHY9_9BACL|nr:pyrimidine-nucleoside phosphorylase [Paenibacillus abyssi]GGF87400.1 pyrimidine-nucleoside phosphorylase [Paenibacillus abyssi]
MRAVDLIYKKRNGSELSASELNYLVQGYCQGEIPDYQMAAWTMAVFFKGLSAAETADLTMAMANSGDQVDLGKIQGIKVDKHSTGGVGDKTTLILAPLVAAAGVPVAKMSGRGLGHTGGTIDKLEAIPGFQIELTQENFTRQVNEIGVAVIGQSGNITPADKKLYALRDVTATVDSIPLIASSVMSKKIAAGADAIVLDVKMGSGAFMKTLDEAEALAQAMVEIGTNVGRRTAAVISDMNQPLGYAIGNALEVNEAILTLQGKGPHDLTELCLTLGAHMVVLGGLRASESEARGLLEQKLRDGSALRKFQQFITAQGGNAKVAEHPELLPKADVLIEVNASAPGTVTAIDAEQLGLAAMQLGAGRATKDAVIDYSVGIVLSKKVGDRVEAGESLAVVHARANNNGTDEILKQIQNAYHISDQPYSPGPLLLSIVTADGIARL